MNMILIAFAAMAGVVAAVLRERAMLKTVARNRLKSQALDLAVIELERVLSSRSANVRVSRPQTSRLIFGAYIRDIADPVQLAHGLTLSRTEHEIQLRSGSVLDSGRLDRAAYSTDFWLRRRDFEPAFRYP